jgi:hypothetical protein
MSDKDELKNIQVILDQEENGEKEHLHTIRDKIVKELVVPNYYTDVQSILLSRKRLRHSANLSELLSKACTASATVVAFAAGAYPDVSYLAFLAGVIGSVAMASQILSGYFSAEQKERTNQANIILKTLNIDSIPEIADTDIA